jgi:hypothetical protein
VLSHISGNIDYHYTQTDSKFVPKHHSINNIFSMGWWLERWLVEQKEFFLSNEPMWKTGDAQPHKPKFDIHPRKEPFLEGLVESSSEENSLETVTLTYVFEETASIDTYDLDWPALSRATPPLSKRMDAKMTHDWLNDARRKFEEEDRELALRKQVGFWSGVVKKATEVLEIAKVGLLGEELERS